MGRADLDPTGLVSLFVGMIQSPPSALSGIGVTYDPFSVGNPDNIEDLLNFSKGIFPSLTGGIDFDKGTLPSFTTFLLSGFNAGTLPNLSENFDLTSGTLPNLGFGSISSLIDFSDPFGSNAYSPFSSIIGSFNGEDPVSPANAVWTTIKSSLMASGMYPADPTNFESQIFSNYTLDIVQQGIGTLSSAVTFLTSLGSILDPEDIFSEGVDVVANVVSLIIYGAYADINLGVAYESGAGDYAEWLLRADPNELIRPGDVVGVIGGKISRKFTHADRFMVVSTSPLLLGNMPDNRADERFYEKIAFIGQVPVKVMGKVNVGDYILPSGSGDGVAIAVSPEDMLARDYQHIIGVAWESNTTDDFIKLVNTAVGVNHNDMSKVIEQMQYTLNNVQASLQKLDPSFEAHMYNVSDYAGAVARPDYHVSSTHVSRVSGYFDNKTYTNRAEMLTDVKNAMTDKAGIDLSKVPFMEYIFENPYQAERLASEYQQVLDDMIMVREQLVLQQGD